MTFLRKLKSEAGIFMIFTGIGEGTPMLYAMCAVHVILHTICLMIRTN